MPEVRGGFLKASYVASGNLSQYRFVNFSGVDVYLPPTSGSIVLGVTQNHPNDNEQAALVTLGHTRITLGGSLAAGAVVMTGLNGFATLAQSGQFVGGYLVSAADSGLVAEMVFTPWRSFGGAP